MPPAIRTPIGPEGINEFVDYYGNKIPVPQVDQPQQAFRGFTNVPGYAFQGEGISTEYIPEQPDAALMRDYGADPNALTIGGQDPGIAPVLPPEEYARFEERTKPIAPSINDMARMSPAEVGPAIEKQIGPRPTGTELKASLYKEAQGAFYNHYIATENREPSAQAWALFDEQWNKDPKVMSTIKLKQSEYDNQYKKLETQAADTRERKKVLDGRYKDAITDAKKKIDLLPPDSRKGAMLSFQKELSAAMKDPVNMEQNIAMAVSGIPETVTDVKGDLTDAAAIQAIRDAFKDTVEPETKKKSLQTYLRLISKGISRANALDTALSVAEMPPAETNEDKIIKDTGSNKAWKSDGIDWIGVTP